MTVTVAPWGFLSLHFHWLPIQFAPLIFWTAQHRLISQILEL